MLCHNRSNSLHVRLKLRQAAAATELQKSSTRALGSVVKQHASTMLVTECTYQPPRSSSSPDVESGRLWELTSWRDSDVCDYVCSHCVGGLDSRCCSGERIGRKRFETSLQSFWRRGFCNCAQQTRLKQELGIGAPTFHLIPPLSPPHNTMPFFITVHLADYISYRLSDR
eukprot:COSAG05_NODE_3051_length_2382_cov_2.250986_1_plen_170_part_00